MATAVATDTILLMAEPTLKDVLDVIAQLRSDTKTDIAQLRSEVATVAAQLRSEVATVAAKVDAHRAETAKGFAEVDRELTKHADVHREVEKDIEALKRRPARTAARPTTRRR